VSSPEARPLVEALAGELADLSRLPGAQCVKENRVRSVWRIPLGTRCVYLKCHRVRGVGQSLKYLFAAPRALAEWRAAHGLRACGIAAAPPLAVGLRRRGPWLVEGIFIAEEVGGEPFAKALAHARESSAGDAAVRAWVEDLLALHARLETRAVFHPDLHGGNLIARADDPDARLVLVDLHAVRLLGRLGRGLPLWRRRMRTKLAFSLWKLLDRSAFEHALQQLAPGAEARLLAGIRARERRRLRSRSRRCVVPSSAFRRERSGAWRGWRRREVPAPDVLALVASGASGPQRLCVDGELRKVCVWRRAWPAWFREWKGLHALRVRGVPAPRAHACLSRRRLFALREAVLVTEDVEDLQPLAGEGAEAPPAPLLDAAMGTAQRLHAHGLSARPERLRVRVRFSEVEVLALPMEARVPDRALSDSQCRAERERLRSLLGAGDGV